ncbi:MAG: hypothetical protein LBV07_03810 [Syntrophobacterales bacterium]|nr:hypothetical protein [Syntrophobacterales bacterium]
MRKFWQYVLVFVLTVILGFSGGCGGDEQHQPSIEDLISANGERNKINDDPKIYILDISEISNWNYMALGSDGSSIFFNVNENTDIPTRVFLKPDKNSDTGFTFFFKENGLPDKMIYDGHILEFGNFRGTKLDIILTYPDKKVERFHSIETDVNWDDYSGISIQPASIQSIHPVSIQLVSIIPNKLKKTLKYISYGVGIVTCAAVLIPPLTLAAAVACGSVVLSEVAKHVACDKLTPDGFLSETCEGMIDIIGCAGKKYDPNTWVSCVNALVNTVDLLSYIGQDIIPKTNAGEIKLIAVSDRWMNWSDAKAWCQQQGGRLPLIDGKDGIDGGQLGYFTVRGNGLPVEGFGNIGGPWPSQLPCQFGEFYWTGTENTWANSPYYAFYLSCDHNGKSVGAHFSMKSGNRYAACVQ